MKCDELKQVENPIECGLYYDKAEVDEAIAELKHQIWEADERAIDAGATSHEKMQESEAKDKEIEKLKKKLAECERMADYHFKAHKEISGGWRVSLGDYQKKEKELAAKNHALFLARSERNKFLASVTHCQGSMNWRNEKLQEKLFKRAAKLLQASETCKAYAEKFK